MRNQVLDLLKMINTEFGYDFLSYKIESVEKRISMFLVQENFSSIAILKEELLKDPRIFERLIAKISISVSTMFRDPVVYRLMQGKVLPILATYPRIRVWSAGTGSGEEAYSIAILLKEANLYQRSLIYATDINPMVLEKAHKGIYDLDRVSEFTSNYLTAGGRESFSKYYTTSNRYAQIAPELRDNIVFATHNLAQDSVFNEFHLIVCRNVLIYFNKVLKDRTLTLMSNSLCERGYLCLGSGEELRYSKVGLYFETLDKKNKLYRKY